MPHSQGTVIIIIIIVIIIIIISILKYKIVIDINLFPLLTAFK